MLKKIGNIALITVLSSSLFACSKADTANNSGQSAAEVQKLTIVDWDSELIEMRKKTIIEPFEKKYSVKIEIETPPDYGKLKAMVDSGNVTWDVVNVDSFFGKLAGSQGLFEPLDYNIVKKDGYNEQSASEHFIASESFATVISWNTTKIDAAHAPKTWADFWDVNKYPGGRSAYKFPAPILEMALLADGVPADKLYPLDLDRAFKKLNEIKKNFKTWWTNGAQVPDLLVNGTATISTAYDGTIALQKQKGTPVDFTYENAIRSYEGWVIPKGTKNKDLAMKFIAFATSPEVQAEFGKTARYAPANQKAIDMLSEQDMQRLGVTPELQKQQIMADDSYWIKNFDQVQLRFEQWLLE
ncbi:ABC transporter substrate-binding protein [Brevibacillus choshinensis]|uniref:ABC transporter substrate-binding protein n=1 Tax=Brevibacillus choshinensis TaxID=54911 RepID=UPI002E1DBB02|nr:ABC transporter substrate-binding protein [Brevibacillus choshinensis]MED4755049.1 ABC transporter substrate-binding protein [Brevibacillus choshinensis]